MKKTEDDTLATPIPPDMPTMPVHCATCFFNPANPDPAGQASVLSRTLLQASLYCHKDQMKGNPPTHLCKGARQAQCDVLYAVRLIDEPTDEAFRAKSKEILGR